MLRNLPTGRPTSFIQRTAGFTLPMLLAITTPLSCLAQQGLTAYKGSTHSGTPSSLTDDAYTLGPGDRVRIDVFKLTQLSGEFQVLADGSLNLPQVGSIPVTGMTLKEAANAISEGYTQILKYPIVSVNVLTPRPVQASILGEVNRPGAYTLTEAGQIPTVARALRQAGGITQMADLRRVEVRRPRRSGEQVIKVNLWDFLQTGDSRQDVTLRAGDAIFVPTLSKTNLAESIQLASTSFSADKSQALNVAVVGEVYRPGPHTVTASARTGAAGETGQASGSGGVETPPTITSAIQIAGGIKPQADIRQIQVRRLTKSGGEQTIVIDLLKLLKEGDVSQDLFLQDRDTIVVPTVTTISPAESIQIAAASFSPDSIRVNIVGEVKQPGAVKIPPNTPLNQAVLAAGGFTTRARTKSVDLIRLNPNGTITKRNIGINFDNQLNDQTNPALYNDDIIIVNRSALTTFSDSVNSALNPINNFLSLFSIYRIITGK
ncbi:sugar ABC transporter substrate-binding protein [Phormidesmis priestleyi ULC007]|uniref:Sugar ABC transporter substrate-binding protein n=1 Tax=Phormidesmis priestleyi ULC007 TaxID=1920490 RepID=A0A2T1D3B5_9CYAN|nr:SLBB domain-containing protein [Phormidesmis priestleyi]PSB14904.1 sugar ABC transporter substrate-binding protein [Phormidesmis priestleyi ULC007]